MRKLAVITAIVMVLSLALAAYIVVRHLGLIDGFDFGAGQYYYTDIPGWERFFSVDCFKDNLPLWIYFALFFGWGYFMYWLWGRFKD